MGHLSRDIKKTVVNADLELRGGIRARGTKEGAPTLKVVVRALEVRELI